MGPPSNAQAKFALFRFPSLESMLLLLLLLQMHTQTPWGFLAPAPPPGPGNAARAADVLGNNASRSPPAAPRPAAGAATAATVEAGSTDGANAIKTGTGAGSDEDSTGARAEAAAGRDPSSRALSEFQEFVERRKAGARRVVLDLRPADEFRREHLEGSTSIPVQELEPRLLELPPPFAQPVSIVGNREDRQAASEFLTKKGWRIDAEIGTDLVVAAGGDDEAEGWPTEAGSTSVQVWRANDFLEFCVERFLLPSSASGREPSAGAGNDSGLVLDLGCGSGRDAVYLAQHLPPGTRVIGVDNHSYALDRAARLACQWLEDSPSSSHEGETRGGGEGGSSTEEGDVRTREAMGVDSGSEKRAGGTKSSRAAERCGGERDGDSGAAGGGPPGPQRRRSCEWLLADLRKEGSLEGLQAFVVHGHRFKCEQLLPLLRDDVLLPGGYFIWSTFLDTGTENLVPPWRPSRMMRPGELASIFSGDRFEILVDERGELPTRGSVVPASFFACRKKP